MNRQNRGFFFSVVGKKRPWDDVEQQNIFCCAPLNLFLLFMLLLLIFEALQVKRMLSLGMHRNRFDSLSMFEQRIDISAAMTRLFIAVELLFQHSYFWPPSCIEQMCRLKWRLKFCTRSVSCVCVPGQKSGRKKNWGKISLASSVPQWLGSSSFFKLRIISLRFEIFTALSINLVD